jgi:two-component system cell cycle sensor histidine kinase PleC
MRQLFRRHVSLRPFMAVVLVFYNAILGLQVLRDYRAAVEAATLRAGNAAAVLAGQVATYLTFVDTTLDMLDAFAARLPPLAEDDASVDTLRSLMAAKTRQLDMIRGFLVTGSDGHMVMDEAGRPTVPLDLSDRDYVRAHAGLGTRGIFVGEPVVGRTSGRWFLGVSRWRQAADGGFGGVITAVVEPAFLARTLAAADLGGRGVAALVSGSGTIIARSPGHDAAVGHPAGRFCQLSGQEHKVWGSLDAPDIQAIVFCPES